MFSEHVELVKILQLAENGPVSSDGGKTADGTHPATNRNGRNAPLAGSRIQVG